MWMRNFLLCVLVAAAILGTPANARVDVDVSIAPPPARVEVVPAPQAGYVWTPGYWSWDGYQHIWIDGHLIEDQPGYRWVPGRWDHNDRHYRFEPGRWEHNRFWHRDHRGHEGPRTRLLD